MQSWCDVKQSIAWSNVIGFRHEFISTYYLISREFLRSAFGTHEFGWCYVLFNSFQYRHMQMNSFSSDLVGVKKHATVLTHDDRNPFIFNFPFF